MRASSISFLTAVLVLSGCAKDSPSETNPASDSENRTFRFEAELSRKKTGEYESETRIAYTKVYSEEYRSLRIAYGDCRVVDHEDAKRFTSTGDSSLAPPAGTVHYVECPCEEGPGEWDLALTLKNGKHVILARYLEEGDGLYISKWVEVKGDEVDACNAMIDGHGI